MRAKKQPYRGRRVPLPAALPRLHALLAPATTFAFDALGIGAALYDEHQWHAIHAPEQTVTEFELAHGRETERATYNERLIKRARTTRKAELGEHAGFFDFFVPVMGDGEVYAVLV